MLYHSLIVVFKALYLCTVKLKKQRICKPMKLNLFR
nr:MAG TPA: hypothetical protein [Bacteriophage sp.]DAI15850.1 MAG TPA: hypothetical protein [Caudoviricetes sp.]